MKTTLAVHGWTCFKDPILDRHTLCDIERHNKCAQDRSICQRFYSPQAFRRCRIVSIEVEEGEK